MSSIVVDAGALRSGLLTVSGILLAQYLWTRFRQRRKYPSGPFCFPVIGNIPQIILHGSVGKFMKHCRKKYGNVYTIEFGGEKKVVVTGYATVYDVVMKNADHTSNRTARSMPKTLENIAKETPGLVWAKFPQWKTLRSFTINTLREEGMGKSSLEPRIVFEMESFINYYIAPNVGKPIILDTSVSQFNNNIISQMLSSTRIEYGDPQLQYLVDHMQESLALNSQASLLRNIPLIDYFPSIKRERELTSEILVPAMMKHIEEHKKTLGEESEPRDLIDRFLMHKNSLKGSIDPAFKEANGPALLLQLYLAGTDTTSQAFKWVLFYLSYYPETQKKARDEIQQVFGLDKQVDYRNRTSLPYVDALLQETLRKSAIAFGSLPHVAEKDIEVDGKVIPAGTDLLIDLLSVMHDGDVFDDPHLFKPERYLTGDTQLLRQRTIPFGLGRRACAAEPLARMELFIFAVMTLQRYYVALAPGSANVKDEAQEKFANCPPSHELIFTAIS